MSASFGRSAAAFLSRAIPSGLYPGPASMACGMRLLRYSTVNAVHKMTGGLAECSASTRAEGSISSALAQGSPASCPKQTIARTSAPNSFRIIIQHTPSYNHRMTRFLFAACVCLAGALALLAQRSATRPADIPFEKHTLDVGANESCAIADINGDGRPDIVSGENWYEAPSWIKHKFRSLPYTNNYIDNFSDLPLDVNGDGRVDIVSCSHTSAALACTLSSGSTVSCPATTHTVSFGAGALRAIGALTTQASDATANVTASFQCQ